jgi:hypothetical protein
MSDQRSAQLLAENSKLAVPFWLNDTSDNHNTSLSGSNRDKYRGSGKDSP